jgi:hypothetical protein
MNRKTRLTCLFAALAVAGTAQAAKPLTQKERAAKAQEIRQAHRHFQQPRTIAQAEAGIARLPDGGTALAMPTELWPHLSVQRDADGKLRTRETEGDAAPASLPEEASHE